MTNQITREEEALVKVMLDMFGMRRLKLAMDFYLTIEAAVREGGDDPPSFREFAVWLGFGCARHGDRPKASCAACFDQHEARARAEAQEDTPVPSAESGPPPPPPCQH